MTKSFINTGSPLAAATREIHSREPRKNSGSVTITLPPLRDPEIATMYAHLLGSATYPADLLSPLVELADGNPLYAHVNLEKGERSALANLASTML